MPISPDTLDAAQTHGEALDFIEAFARVNIDVIRRDLGSPTMEIARAEQGLVLDWDDPLLLAESGLTPAMVDDEVRAGQRYLHIDMPASNLAEHATALFLGFTGLSDKQQRCLFPVLWGQPPRDRERLREEVPRLNAWLDWVCRDGFDPAAFITYQRGVGIHGRGQNRTGIIGATGAAVAFIDAINQSDPTAIADHVGDLPPAGVRSPREIFDWREGNPNATVKSLLLRNGRALVFASSKDANIFMPLDTPFADGADALARFNRLRKNPSV